MPRADGEMDDVSAELKAFLDYIAGKPTDDSFVQELDEAVKEAKKNRKWRHEYMTLLMRDRMNVEKGIEQGITQGIAQGEDRLSRLIVKFIENNCSQEVIKATQDKEYRNKLYKEYLID